MTPMTPMKAILVLVLGLVSSGAARAQAPFSYEEAGFAVAFPEAPQSEARPADNADQPAFRRYWTQGETTFSVTVDQFPEGLRLPKPRLAAYRRLLVSHAQQGRAEVVSMRGGEVSGSPFMEGVFRHPDRVTEVRRVLMVGGRVFQLSVSAPGDQPSPDAPAFFDTFRGASVNSDIAQPRVDASLYNSQANVAAMEQDWPVQIVAAAKAYRSQPTLMHEFNLATGYLNTGRTALAIPLFEDLAVRGHWTFLKPVYDYRRLRRQAFVNGSLADEATRRLEAIAPTRPNPVSALPPAGLPAQVGG